MESIELMSWSIDATIRALKDRKAVLWEQLFKDEDGSPVDFATDTANEIFDEYWVVINTIAYLTVMKATT